MPFEVATVGFVEASRAEPEDDFWGGESAAILLTDDFGPEALDGLEEFSHVEVIFLFHRVDPAEIATGLRHPRGRTDWPAVGIFAQRGKNRPNRLGSTICRILGREGRRLRVADLDAIEGTPVLDLKPVMREFLPRSEVWQPAWSREIMERYWDRSPNEEE